MLQAKDIPKKTFEELFGENLGKIPIYSGEWTNYNAADPGITIMENLTALQIIQQNRIDEMPDTVRVRLLNLLGYRQKKGACAEVWLEAAGGGEAFDLPAGRRFMAGDISFETTRPIHVSTGCIMGVFSRTADAVTDCSHILDRNRKRYVEVFGGGAEEEASLWLVMDEPPQAGEERVVYVEAGGRERRNPFSDEAALSFAEICWECSTEEGFVPMRAEDGTHGFLTDGFLKLRQPEGCRAARVEQDGISGYVWRARLVRGEYDAPPALRYLSGFLFPVSQKETMAGIYAFRGAGTIVLQSMLPDDGYFRVYAKEEKGGSYTAYEEGTGEGGRGYYYRKEKLGPGKYAVSFDRKRFGHAPGRFQDAVKIVIYSEEMMKRYDLGDVYGFDEQTIRLPAEHVLAASFCVIAARMTPHGETVYDFLKPGRQDGQDMHYSLYGNEGRLVIHDPGSYVGAKLYLGSVAVTRGPEGNVRPGNVFFATQPVCKEEVHFTNPAPGKGGAFPESFEEMRRRFVKDWGEAETAVTSLDYETLVRRVPGLCIDKVRAWIDHEKNEVQIAVLPGSREAFPGLSEKYEQEIGRWLENRRLLSTGIRIRQPVYAAVLVNGAVCVKPHYEGCLERIEAVLRDVLNYVQGSAGFGERLRFEKIFHEVENLDCVAYVQELVIRPENPADVTMDGADIIPAPNCLLYPGSIRLDILPLTGG